MKKLLLVLGLLSILTFSGCAMFMPNTAKVLEPNGFDDLAIAIGADVEMFIEMVGEYGWLGVLLL